MKTDCVWIKECDEMSDKDKLNKKPYERPEVVHSQVLESVAGACPPGEPTNGKTGTDQTCLVISS